jgi:hypothetical protein
MVAHRNRTIPRMVEMRGFFVMPVMLADSLRRDLQKTGLRDLERRKRVPVN